MKDVIITDIYTNSYWHYYYYAMCQEKRKQRTVVCCLLSGKMLYNINSPSNKSASVSSSVASFYRQSLCNNGNWSSSSLLYLRYRLLWSILISRDLFILNFRTYLCVKCYTLYKLSVVLNLVYTRTHTTSAVQPIVSTGSAATSLTRVLSKPRFSASPLPPHLRPRCWDATPLTSSS